MPHQSNTQVSRDPSTSSFYVSNEFYDALIADFSSWIDDNCAIAEIGLRDAVARFLYKEARMLDEKRLEDWLALFAPECIYWVPVTSDGGDPRREVAISFDDRRRLEDRVFRLGLAQAWSQRPASRTVHNVGNIELFGTEDEQILMVRSAFTISEFWAGETRIWSGWCGHRLGHVDNKFEILVKQVNLIDHDQNLRNPSILF
jgi:3-phenylpropionate/cinnamic acid dioxygenase small subunit